MRLLWHDYRYFPYERMLAEREARLLLGEKPTEDGDALRLSCSPAEELVNRLTYFKAAQTPDGILVPDQAKLEASGNGQAWNPRRDPIPSLRRQSTRYSAHGLHEYRGKFNPHVHECHDALRPLERAASGEHRQPAQEHPLPI